jgi:hypothetical protein
MIKGSTACALVIEGVIVAKGSAAAMRSLRRKRGGTVWRTSKKVGEAVK